MKKLLILSLVIGMLGLGVFAFASEQHPSDEPLKLPFDMGYKPFHYYNEDQEPVGFGIEVSREVADRLGRPGIEVVNVNWSGIFSGLFAKKYEAIFFTLDVTQERAERMDYTEPFMNMSKGVAVREASKDEITKPKALDGKTMGVNSGSVSDDWATENQDQYGFKLQRFDKLADAIMGLKTKRVDAVMADLLTINEITGNTEGITTNFQVFSDKPFGTGAAGEAFAFRKGDPYRKKVERVLEGMKLDGTLQEIYRDYFGEPNERDYINTVFKGYGTPGLRAYEPTPHEPYFPEDEE